MFARQAINACAQVGVQTGGHERQPAPLIVMLYDGARSAIAREKFHLENGEVSARGNAISKAINIIDTVCARCSTMRLAERSRQPRIAVRVHDPPTVAGQSAQR